jgi:hypothetical protein
MPPLPLPSRIGLVKYTHRKTATGIVAATQVVATGVPRAAGSSTPPPFPYCSSEIHTSQHPPPVSLRKTEVVATGSPRAAGAPIPALGCSPAGPVGSFLPPHRIVAESLAPIDLPCPTTLSPTHTYTHQLPPFSHPPPPAQVLSTKGTAPSFSFGTGKARLAIKLCGIPRPDALTPSAIPRLSDTPGHKYNTAPRWSQRAPRFGTETQRPASYLTGAKVSSATGWSTEPGPGAYPLPPSLGVQVLAGTRSSVPQTIGAMPNEGRGMQVHSSPSPPRPA